MTTAEITPDCRYGHHHDCGGCACHCHTDPEFDR